MSQEDAMKTVKLPGCDYQFLVERGLLRVYDADGNGIVFLSGPADGVCAVHVCKRPDLVAISSEGDVLMGSRG